MKITFLQLLFIPVLAFTLLSANCQQTDLMTATDATINMNVMSRGVYQCLISIDKKTYISENLPTEFQQDKLKVVLDYKILDKKAPVYKPGATDIPQEDYQLTVIDIVNIKKK